MNLPVPSLLAVLLATGLSGCYYNDDYYNQPGVYGDPTASGPSAYGGGQPQPYGNPPATPPGGQYGTDHGSESGDVVTLPGDGSAGGYGGTPGAYNPGYRATPPPSSYDPGIGNPAGQIYTVRKGDNLYRIGKAHGVTMQEIIEQNGLQSTTIHPGQQLIIP